MICNIIYDNNKDREFLKLIDNKFPVFINLIDFNTVNGRKEAYKIKSYWGAKKNPFVEVLNEDSTIKCFYSDDNSNAILKFTNWLKEQ